MNFSAKLQQLRKEKGLSQERLAELIGVSRQAVSKWESGQACPEVDKLVALGDLFGVTVDQLVRDEQTVQGEYKEPFAEERGRYGYDGGPSPWRMPLWHYEYKSRRRLFGLPLIHIHFGVGPCVAKGIFALGNISLGVVSVGAVAAGGLCFGGLAAGLLLALGGVAVGAVAVGGAGIGLLALGGFAVGMFSIGGCAIASHIALGGFASGHIAIGNQTSGAYTIYLPSNGPGTVPAAQVRALIRQEYPNLWKPVADLFTAIFRLK